MSVISRVSAAGAACLLAAALALPSHAETAEDCIAAEQPADVIEACTAFIESGNAAPVARQAALQLRCVAHEEMGALDLAHADCLDVVILSGGEADALLRLARIEMAQGSAENALTSFEAAVSRTEMTPDLLVLRADIHCARGGEDGIARSQEDRLAALAAGTPDAPTLQRVLKDAGFYQGRIDGAFGRGSRGALSLWTEAGCP